MGKYKMKSPVLRNVPWQERPAEVKGAPIWRYSGNPVIGRNPIEGVARIFNSAVIPYRNGFIGVFRGEQTNGVPDIYLGHSDDGLQWEFQKDKIKFLDEEGKPFMPVYAYDPRLVKVEDTYYIMWCQDFYGASIGMAKTLDFQTFTRIENPFLPFNRNAVLFPRKINGNFVLMSRPSDSGHTPFGDIFISESQPHITVSRTVIDSNPACFGIMQRRARKTHIRHESSLLIPLFRCKQEIFTSVSDFRGLVDIQNRSSNRVHITITGSRHTVVK